MLNRLSKRLPRHRQIVVASSTASTQTQCPWNSGRPFSSTASASAAAVESNDSARVPRRSFGRPMSRDAYGRPLPRSDDNTELASGKRKTVQLKVPASGKATAEDYEALVHRLIAARQPIDAHHLNTVCTGLLEELQGLGLHPTKYTLTHMLTAACLASDFEQVYRLMDLHKAYWIAVSPRNVHEAVVMMCKEGCLEQAIVFVESHQTQQSATASASASSSSPQADASQMYDRTVRYLIRHLLEANEADVALTLLKAIDARAADLHRSNHSGRSLSSDIGYCYRCLMTFASLQHAGGVQYVWDVAVRSGKLIDLDEGSLSVLLNVCSRQGLPVLATEIIKTASGLGIKPSADHYACLLDAYAVRGDLRNAMTVLALMRRSGVPPAPTTADGIIRAIGPHDGEVESAFAILLSLHGQDPSLADVAALNAIIDGCANAQAASRALATFEEATKTLGIQPDSNTLDALLRACVAGRQKTLALGVVDTFTAQYPAIKLSRDAYECITVVCLLRADYEDAFEWLERCKDAGHIPSAKLYKSVVRRLLRSQDPRAKVAMDEMQGFGYKDVPLARLVDSTFAKNIPPSDQQQQHQQRPFRVILVPENSGVLDRIRGLLDDIRAFVPYERIAQEREALAVRTERKAEAQRRWQRNAKEERERERAEDRQRAHEDRQIENDIEMPIEQEEEHTTTTHEQRQAMQ
ncbi:hypothetical protein PYCC9005_004325 [Savitreella phatthalungensis]